MIKKKNNTPLYNWVKWLLPIGLVFMIIAPILFTRPWGVFPFDNSTGVIGDTIGGITAPFINFIGAILVFISFKEQQRANKIQYNGLKEEINLNKNISNYNQIIELISYFKNQVESPRELFKNSDNKGNYTYTVIEYLKYYSTTNQYTAYNNNNIKLFNRNSKPLEAFCNDIENLKRASQMIIHESLSDNQKRILSYRIISYLEDVFTEEVNSLFITLSESKEFLDQNTAIAIRHMYSRIISSLSKFSEQEISRL